MAYTENVAFNIVFNLYSICSILADIEKLELEIDLFPLHDELKLVRFSKNSKKPFPFSIFFTNAIKTADCSNCIVYISYRMEIIIISRTNYSRRCNSLSEFSNSEESVNVNP